MAYTYLRKGSTWYPEPEPEVAPLVNDALFGITDAYTNGQAVGTGTISNTPNPATITWSIIAGNDDAVFEISPSSGLISIADESALSVTEYSLTVQASNGVTPDGTATITIPVTEAGAQQLLFSSEILNGSGSTTAQSGDWTFPTYHTFKKGDLPSGAFPVYEANGNTLAYSYAFKKTHDDGSTAGMMVMFRLAESISASGTLAYDCYNAGIAPANGSRASTDGDSSSDHKIEADLFQGGTGTWTSQLKYASPLLSITAPGSGGPNLYLKRRQPFRQSSADHAQLFADWYVIKLENASGGFYGQLIFRRVMQSFVDRLTDRGVRGFSACRVMDDASTIRDMVTQRSGTARTFTADASTDTITCSASPGLETYTSVRFSNSGGALPAGLSTDTVYKTLNPSGNNLRCGTSISAVANITDAGTGTHTVTPVIALNTHNSFHCPAADSEMDFSQSGGTGNAPLCIIKQDPTYMVSTQLFGPVDLTASHSSNPAMDYTPEGANGLTRTEANSGGGGDQGRGLSPLHAYFVRHLCSQTLTNRRAVRVLGLNGGHRDIASYDSVTNRVVILNNGPNDNGTAYSSPLNSTPRPTWRINPPFEFSGAPNDSAYSTGSCFRLDTSHAPCLYGYPFLITGEWQYMDMAFEVTQMGVCASSARASLAGTTYYGSSATTGSARQDAWNLRDTEWAVRVAADDSPELDYVTDLRDDRLAFWVAKVTPATSPSSYFNSYLLSIGFPNCRVVGSQESGFMIGFLCSVFALIGGGPNSTADGTTMLEYVAKFCGQFDAFFLPAADFKMSKTAVGADGFVTDDSEFLFGGSRTGASWALDGTVTLDANAQAGWTPVNDALVAWISNVPGGLTAGVNYWTRDVTATTFKVSATQGGSALTFSNTGSGGLKIGQMTPKTNKGISTNSSNYTTVWTGTVAIVKAAGPATDLSSNFTKLKAIRADLGFSVTTDSGFAFTDFY